MVETTLTVFGMLPAIVFVASAVLRDHDTATAELFFVKPISRWQYLWGRFGAACLLSALLGLAGILGSLTGTLMPWVDQERIAEDDRFSSDRLVRRSRSSRSCSPISLSSCRTC